MLRTLWDRLLRRERHEREPGVSAEERRFADDGITEKKQIAMRWSTSVPAT